ncbi:MAG: NADH-quinone oxidoreductase subunit L [Candidatus Omnitrophica bacterium]|nr:NADH-quinone oxidoreductase subunit L [Candidatus Omnitrophota bacterium]
MATKGLLICLLPLLSFWILMFFGRNHLPSGGDWIAMIAIGLSLCLSYSIYHQAIGAYESGDEFFYHQSEGNIASFEWIAFTNPDTGERTPWKLGFWIDSLTAIMLMVVAGISFLVHLFSLGYMKGEENYSRYFGYLGIFSFSMLLLVLTDNLFVLYICWELVGVSSFLLIGFFINKDSAAAAAKKAFLTNRVGDLGFAIGLFIVYNNFHTFSIREIFDALANGAMADSPWTLTFMGLGLFCGAVGKSAQFPLHIWLPDAMEGPTPVSALIHAATMVAAGVYLVARLFPVFNDTAFLVIAYIGTFTAIMAATIAITQFDIKRVLAYSTLSQLGYMVAALGVGAYSAALFHLTTHAFFKALLFLCSGSVIHALHHEQDMRNMGGLAGKTKVTFITMLVGTLAISGVPFFSGFYSKDKILAGALEMGMINPHHAIIFIALLLAAGITAFYMFRLIFMTFTGKPRDRHAWEHAHEGPWTMQVPLVVLAILAICSGWTHLGLGGFFQERVVPWGTEAQVATHHADAPTLFTTAAFAQEEGTAVEEHSAHGEAHDEPVANAAAMHEEGHHDVQHTAHVVAMILSILVATSGIILSALTYWERIRVIDPAKCARAMGPVYDLVYNKYYVDEFYARTFYRGLEIVRNVLARFDLRIIDGIVNGAGRVTVFTSGKSGRFDLRVVDRIVDWIAEVCQHYGQRIRRVESGVIQDYALKVGGAFGTMVILWMIVRSFFVGA